MKRYLKSLALALLVVMSLGNTHVVQAEERYITDIVYVPLRAGPGNEYRILHRGLRTGTRMNILEADAGNNYSKVSMSDGTEGYILTQYLINQAPARERLPKEQEKNRQLTSDLAKSHSELKQKDAELTTAKKNLKSTSRMLDEKTTELVALREATADPLALDRRNKQLMEENLRLKNSLEVTQAENTQLVRNNSIRWYLYGGGTILVGILLGLFLPMIRFRKKPASDWA